MAVCALCTVIHEALSSFPVLYGFSAGGLPFILWKIPPDFTSLQRKSHNMSFACYLPVGHPVFIITDDFHKMIKENRKNFDTHFHEILRRH